MPANILCRAQTICTIIFGVSVLVLLAKYGTRVLYSSSHALLICPWWWSFLYLRELIKTKCLWSHLLLLQTFLVDGMHYIHNATCIAIFTQYNNHSAFPLWCQTWPGRGIIFADFDNKCDARVLWVMRKDDVSRLL